MNKFQKTFLLVLLCLITYQLRSQSNIGFKLGYTNAWPGYNDPFLPEDAETNVNGFNLSASYYRNVVGSFRLGIEPGFVRRGAACLPGWQPIFVGDSRVRLNYFELPIMLSSSHALFHSKFSLFGKLGVGGSYLLSAFEELDAVNEKDEPTVNRLELQNGRMNRFDYGIYSNLGFGYSITDRLSLILESSFYYGLRDFEQLNTSKNRSLSFNVGVNSKL